jgi:hypothetical protein
MRVTCNASYYEDNSDSCELWVPGSPLSPSGEFIDIVRHPQAQADRDKFEVALGTITGPSMHR